MDSPRDHLLRAATLLLAVLLLPIGYLRAPGRTRHFAAQWALGLRYPHEDLTGLTAATRDAFTAARTEALWRHGLIIGLTSGHRDPAEQLHLFAEAVARTGSLDAARQWVLPPQESSHVKGTALDVRPVQGARWLEGHGARYGLYRIYDNEWWHFEHRRVPPRRLPHPGRRSA